MEQLKNIDQASNENQNYISKEKENLIRNKFDSDTTHLNQLRNSLTSYATSPPNSGKFRGSYLSNGSELQKP